ncbi:MAG: A24 family peptidase [Actinomycetota bacterium]
MSLIVGLALIGLVVGPWLGVIADRAPDRIVPRAEHRCPHCEVGWGLRSMLPFVDWWGRCPACEHRKGTRYVLIDVSTAVVFAAVAWRFGGDWRLVPYLALGAVLVALSVIDVETHLLPNVVVYPSIAVGLFAVLVLSGELGYTDGLFPALLGAALFFGFTGAAHLVYEPGMGLGDVKLSLLLGLFIGWLHPSLLTATRLVLYALVLASLGGGLIGLAVNLIRRRRGEIPFGPALAAATIAVIVASPTLSAGP